MGLLQAAYRTYETQSHLVGIVTEAAREPLVPVSHSIQKAQIELTITDEGLFSSAQPVPTEDSYTIIPATVESPNRSGQPVGDNIRPHPLCDQIDFISSSGGEKYNVYLRELTRWAQSEYSHPKVRAVWKYIESGTILADLTKVGLITLDENGQPSGKLNGTECEKCLVRFRVIPAPAGVSPACWQDTTLFSSYIAYYSAKMQEQQRDLCLISGEQDATCKMHPKGIIPAQNGAKLISSNDSSGFTYRGRFIEASQACNVGYLSSQKAHNALRWVAVNQGVTFGGRTFLCWNPEGAKVPASIMFLGLPSGEPLDFPSYKKALQETLDGYRNQLADESNIVIAALDAATTGRLSVTYYNELKGSDFLRRISRWYESCCWMNGRFGVQSPTLRRIVCCAFGTQRGEKLDLDDKVMREHIQQLLPCIVNAAPIPQDIVRALTTRAGTPLAYTTGSRAAVLSTACALIRKYRNDQKNEEEWTLALDKECSNRSYLFGRLLAVAEQAERATYQNGEERETNAIRMQAVFSQRPMYAWRIIYERLTPYLARMNPGLRAYFKNMICEIMEKLPDAGDPELGKRLEDTYLLGYSHQRNAMMTKKESNNMEETKDE